MKTVRYSHNEGQFNFKEDDYVTIIVRYLHAAEVEDELYYHGTISTIDSEGFAAALDDNKGEERYFAFVEVEKVIPGHLVPYLGGYTRRNETMEDRPMRSFYQIVRDLAGIQTDSMPTFLTDTQFHDEPNDVLEHCLEFVLSDDYKQYVREQLNDEEFISYDFKEIRDAVKKKVEDTYNQLLQD